MTTILDNPISASVENISHAERLEFTRLQPYPGVSVQGIDESPA